MVLMDSNILNGWKQVAIHLHVCSKTAIRWSREEGLPVTIIGRSVIALKTEIDVWVVRRGERK